MDPQDGNGTVNLPPPPPEIPPNVVPLKVNTEPKKRGFQSLGRVLEPGVNLFYEDGSPIDAKGVGRKIIERVKETYDTELGGKDFAYDGEKSLFTVGSLPSNKLEFMVVLEDVVSSINNNGNASPDHENQNIIDKKRIRRPYQSKQYKVELSYAAKIPMQAIANVIKGQENENTMEALRVLHIVM